MIPRTIPQIRDRLHALADTIPDLVTRAELHALADETKRRRPVRDAPPRARHVTKEIAARVRIIAAENPRLPIREIGLQVGIDGGRVSEILAGKRGEPEPRP